MERMGARDLFNTNVNLTDFSESTELKRLDIEHKANQLKLMNPVQQLQLAQY